MSPQRGGPRPGAKPQYPPPSGQTKQTSVGELLEEHWLDFCAFAIPYGFDILKGLLVLLGIFLFTWVASAGKFFHVKEEELDPILLIHKWLNVGTVAIYGLTFLKRLARQLVKRGN